MGDKVEVEESEKNPDLSPTDREKERQTTILRHETQPEGKTTLGPIMEA